MEQEPQKLTSEIKDLPGHGEIETISDEEIEKKQALLKTARERLVELEREKEKLGLQFKEKFKIKRIHEENNNSVTRTYEVGSKTYAEQDASQEDKDHEMVLELARRLNRLKKIEIPGLRDEIEALERNLNA